MQREQSVSEMVEEVLGDQARILAGRTGQSSEDALEAASATHAGRQLRALARGPHRDERADECQEGLLRERADVRLGDLLGSGPLLRSTHEEHHYSWVEGYVEWLEGKEVREQYHALLAEGFLHLKRRISGSGAPASTLSVETSALPGAPLLAHRGWGKITHPGDAPPPPEELRYYRFISGWEGDDPPAPTKEVRG